jgi:hypothetical protein
MKKSLRTQKTKTSVEKTQLLYVERVGANYWEDQQKGQQHKTLQQYSSPSSIRQHFFVNTCVRACCFHNRQNARWFQWRVGQMGREWGDCKEKERGGTDRYPPLSGGWLRTYYQPVATKVSRQSRYMKSIRYDKKKEKEKGYTYKLCTSESSQDPPLMVVIYWSSITASAAVEQPVCMCYRVPFSIVLLSRHLNNLVIGGWLIQLTSRHNFWSFSKHIPFTI